ncbi:amidase-like isoform X2 [Ptychodera flava]|uniref:amidase-like isoform X2 n=1 Tax=Ptychodera flava TaxID=63121 RepID=UPI00396A3C64
MIFTCISAKTRTLNEHGQVNTDKLTLAVRSVRTRLLEATKMIRLLQQGRTSLQMSITPIYARCCSTPSNVGQQDIYKAPAVRVPTVSKLMKIADKFNMDATADELLQYRDFMASSCKAFDVVDSLPEPLPPVKYPRTPGYRPRPEENKLNAWYWRCDIKGADTGKLAGKTIAIKDNIPVAGVPMMNGSYILEGYVPEFDATIVTRILDAGGHIIGKTSAEDLCFSGNSFTCVKGAIRNPYKTDHSAGGSSSGSSALIASGDVDMAIGGDQGGSVREPSTWCGVVALKPTFGLVPYTGILPIELTLDHTGPITKNVYDAALMLEVIAGYDNGLDPRQPEKFEVHEYTAALETKLPGIRVGIVKEGFGQQNSEEDVDRMVKNAALQMTTVGAEVDEISIPEHTLGNALFAAIAFEGGADMMMKGCGAGSQYRGFYPSSTVNALHRGYRTRINDMSHILKAILLFGDYLKQEYGGYFYAKAQNISLDLTKAFDKTFEDYDVLVMPTIPFKAPKLPTQDITIPDIFETGLNTITNTAPYNVTGHPALTINTGFSDGLPVGMMMVGRKFDESTLLKVAYAYEKLRDQIE